jgi:hypothetical protein
MLNTLGRKLLLIGAPVVLVGAGVTTMAASAATPTPTATPSQQSEKPGLPGGGHADSATDANADHQFDGVE